MRAAAYSALRGGWSPFGIDLFCDTDLRAVAPCLRITDYPHQIGALMRHAPPGPWAFTGGLENEPDLIREWSLQRPLFGATPDAVATVRDPFWLSRHLPTPPTLKTAVRYSEGWLLKAMRGSGGRGVRVWRGEPVPPDHYLQQFVPGPSMAGVFVDGRLFGVTRQLVGDPLFHARRFGYCGSIGPLPLTQSQRDWWNAVGLILAKKAGLNGVFGVDAIDGPDGLTAVEVNPRYTASVEVLELATGRAAFSPEQVVGLRQVPEYIGKAVWYAPTAFQFPFDLRTTPAPWSVPEFGDVPALGETMIAGHPVITLYASGPTESDCRAALEDRARRFASAVFP